MKLKSISQYIDKIQSQPQIQRMALDSKTIFFLFEKIIKEEYGNVGRVKLKPDYYKDGKIFVKTESSNWANELWMNRKYIIDKLNQEIGGDDIKDIKVN